MTNLYLLISDSDYQDLVEKKRTTIEPINVYNFKPSKSDLLDICDDGYDYYVLTVEVKRVNSIDSAPQIKEIDSPLVK